MQRVLPLLVFLGTVIVLAELAAAAEVFDVVASRMAIAARGSTSGLFLCCVALASLTTMTLNLDTTAVLLTPVMLVLARKIAVWAVPLAVTTVWLAN
ncbi:MAG TPA: SLC13 family permease, partial [Euzebyales bacterium]|nr:SLC13 family permease [Euzebyales bacterium]